jgi:hypothetical protein
MSALLRIRANAPEPVKNAAGHVIGRTMPRRPTTRVRAYQLQPAEPPREMQLWKPGPNPTDYGVHYWTERSAVEVLATYRARGNPLQVDIEHNNAHAPGPNDPPAQGGYARLELRGGAPWLVFDWSAIAVEQIQTRQRLFLSPEYDVDRETNEIVRLVRVSLVADPGTHHARMLASAGRVRAGGTEMNLALIIAALRAALAAEDPEVSKQQIAALLDEIVKVAGDTPAAEDNGTTPEPPADTTAAADDAPPGDDDEEKKKQAAIAAAADDDEDKDKQEQRAAARRAKKPAAKATASTDPSVLAMAQRLAVLEARDAEREAEARVTAAGAKIPDSLRTFARSLTKENFDAFVAGLPEPPPSREGGVRAAARPPAGRTSGGDALPPEDARVMARIFGTEDASTESITTTPDGRIRASHLARPKATHPNTTTTRS